MKKNNIKQLKEIVSNEIFFDLSYQGVQAYNISANEYEVITGFWKCNGRYYFLDRNNNKYLASRYDRAEFIAGEMLEQKERENKMINEYIDSIEKSGEFKVVFELVYEYINTCEARGIDSGELVAEEEDEATPDEENELLSGCWIGDGIVLQHEAFWVADDCVPHTFEEYKAEQIREGYWEGILKVKGMTEEEFKADYIKHYVQSDAA